MVFKQRFIAKVLIEFLRRLTRQAGRQKLILILDGHPVHRAAAVRRWVEQHGEAIELVFLPGYSPGSTRRSFSTRTSRATRSDAVVRAHKRR